MCDFKPLPALNILKKDSIINISDLTAALIISIRSFSTLFKKISISSDHAGFKLKEKIKINLK